MESKTIIFYIYSLTFVLCHGIDVADLITAKQMSWNVDGEICLSLFEFVELDRYTERLVHYNGSYLQLTLQNENNTRFKVNLLEHNCHIYSTDHEVMCGYMKIPQQNFRKNKELKPVLKPVHLKGYISVFDKVDGVLINQGEIDKSITRVKYTTPSSIIVSTKSLCANCKGVCKRTCKSVLKGTRTVTCKETDENETTLEPHTSVASSFGNQTDETIEHSSAMMDTTSETPMSTYTTEASDIETLEASHDNKKNTEHTTQISSATQVLIISNVTSEGLDSNQSISSVSVNATIHVNITDNFTQEMHNVSNKKYDKLSTEQTIKLYDYPSDTSVVESFTHSYNNEFHEKVSVDFYGTLKKHKLSIYSYIANDGRKPRASHFLLFFACLCLFFP
jgi:hypothetical protein